MPHLYVIAVAVILLAGCRTADYAEGENARWRISIECGDTTWRAVDPPAPVGGHLGLPFPEAGWQATGRAASTCRLTGVMIERGDADDFRAGESQPLMRW